MLNVVVAGVTVLVSVVDRTDVAEFVVGAAAAGVVAVRGIPVPVSETVTWVVELLCATGVLGVVVAGVIEVVSVVVVWDVRENRLVVAV